MLQTYDLTTGEPADRLPDLDVHEKDGELILRAQVRGLHLGGFALAVDQNEVIVDADVWGDADAGSAGGGHHEHLHGRLPLPFATDPSRVTGRVEHDVLEVHIPWPSFEPWFPGEKTT
jgi:HSP20 family molecular chaperone IbpA